MIEVGIKNYQGIKNVDFKVDGYTTILGPSSIGKSSIVRAVETFFSQINENDIHKNEEEAVIKLVGDNFELEKVRNYKKKKNTVRVGDVVNSGVGKSSQDILNEINLKVFKVKDEKINPHIAGQFEPPFLLSHDGTALGEIIGSLLHVTDFNRANEICISEMKSNQIQLSEIKKLKQEFDLKIAVLEKISDIEPNVDKTITSYSNFKNGLNRLDKLKTTYANLKNLFKFRSILEIPKTDLEFKIEIAKYTKIKSIYLLLNRGKAVASVLSELPTANFADKENLSNKLALMSRLKKLLHLIKSQQILLKNFNTPTVFTNKLDILIDNLNKFKAQNSKFVKLKEVLKDINTSIDTSKRELENVLTSIESIKNKLEICPLCETSLSS